MRGTKRISESLFFPPVHNKINRTVKECLQCHIDNGVSIRLVPFQSIKIRVYFLYLITWENSNYRWYGVCVCAVSTNSSGIVIKLHELHAYSLTKDCISMACYDILSSVRRKNVVCVCVCDLRFQRTWWKPQTIKARILSAPNNRYCNIVAFNWV